MPAILDDPAQRATYWRLPLVRAVPAAVLALVITFSADHSAQFGLTSFGLFAIFSGAMTAGVAVRAIAGSGARPYVIAQGIVSAVIGGAALGVRDGGVATFFLVVTVWAALTGALELYSGLRSRRRHVASVDWLTVGAITAIAAVVFVLVPPDLSEQFIGEQGVSGTLDSAVIAVGLLGAYAAIIAVYLAVAGFSAKWGTSKASTGNAEAVKEDRT